MTCPVSFYHKKKTIESSRCICLFPITTPLVKMGDRKVRRLSCPPKIQNILPLNMARAHAAAILDGLACPVHKAYKSSTFQQLSPVQRAFTFCTAAATRLPMGWSGTPTI